MIKVKSTDDLEGAKKVCEKNKEVCLIKSDALYELKADGRRLDEKEITVQAYNTLMFQQQEDTGKIIDSHLAQSDKLDQAFELLGEIVKWSTQNPSRISQICELCYADWFDEDNEIDHSPDCPVGKAQTFLKEVTNG